MKRTTPFESCFLKLINYFPWPVTFLASCKRWLFCPVQSCGDIGIGKELCCRHGKGFSFLKIRKRNQKSPWMLLDADTKLAWLQSSLHGWWLPEVGREGSKQTGSLGTSLTCQDSLWDISTPNHKYFHQFNPPGPEIESIPNEYLHLTIECDNIYRQAI